ncbi:glutathione peroxidase [Silanimonas lenta]|uniref:glutathione peroxidase n=1 Tax=Silanimonas lenta TaxID=265429 RepID=UPI000423D71A|nr:glutathione peroxidase [Silanimonas lenta]
MKAWIAALFVGLGVGLAARPVAAAGVLQHEYRRLASQERVNLAEAYGGKVLLVVNTASKCGFTPQYEGLEALNATYGPQGFAVLGFPSNDFMGQEPGSEEQIQEFCTLTYGVKFPMFEKVVVRGRDATPLYRELAAATGEQPGWNFHKYLIGRDGRVLGSFGSRVKPEAPELRAAIEKALAAPVPAAAPATSR